MRALVALLALAAALVLGGCSPDESGGGAGASGQGGSPEQLSSGAPAETSAN